MSRDQSYGLKLEQRNLLLRELLRMVRHKDNGAEVSTRIDQVTYSSAVVVREHLVAIEQANTDGDRQLKKAQLLEWRRKNAPARQQ